MWAFSVMFMLWFIKPTNLLCISYLCIINHSEIGDIWIFLDINHRYVTYKHLWVLGILWPPTERVFVATGGHRGPTLEDPGGFNIFFFAGFSRDLPCFFFFFMGWMNNSDWMIIENYPWWWFKWIQWWLFWSDSMRCYGIFSCDLNAIYNVVIYLSKMVGKESPTQWRSLGMFHLAI